jgi:tRNA pseudouridine38-40 synthase
MRSIKVTVSYDGAGFCGWQVQAAERTVQGEITRALEKIHKHPVSIVGAGRTDSGVHADGQVFSFQSDIDSIPIERYPDALNANFPPDIRALAAEVVPASFHARYGARSRTYRYRWSYTSLTPAARARTARLSHHPNVARLNRLAAPLLGAHDFSTFTLPTEPSPHRRRVIHSLALFPDRGCIVMQICANAFLWRMVRLIAGTLMELDRGGAEPDEVARRLEACDHGLAGPAAPAHGLTLHAVTY